MVQGAKNRLTRAQAGGDTHNRPDNASDSRVCDAWAGADAEVQKVLVVSCQSNAQEIKEAKKIMMIKKKLAMNFAGP